MQNIKTVFACLILLSVIKSANSQADSNSYYFKEVGMSLKVPNGFEAVESAEEEGLQKKGAKLLEDANDIQVDASTTKNLLSIPNGQYNYLNITITPAKQKTNKSWEKDTQEMKNMVYNSFTEKVSVKNIDTASSLSKVDELVFDKFEMTARINTTMTMKMLIYSKLYKGYDFGIAYTYLNESIGKEISDIVEKAHFKKQPSNYPYFLFIFDGTSSKKYSGQNRVCIILLMCLAVNSLANLSRYFCFCSLFLKWERSIGVESTSTPSMYILSFMGFSG